MKTLQLHFVKPDDAPSAVREIYRDIQNVLGIPWAPALFQAYAVYPQFLELIWSKLRPEAQTEQFLEEALDLAEAACERVSQICRPGYTGAAFAQGDLEHGVREQVCHTLRAFEYGNPQLLILQAALTRALEGSAIAGGGLPCAPQRRGESPFRWLPVHLTGESEAPPSVKRIYADIRQTLGLPMVNSDYLALAQWPDYLALAWGDLKPLVSTEEYRRAQDELADRAVEALNRFAFPFGLSAEDYCDAGLSEDDLTDIRDRATIFWGLLPGLMLNVAGFLQALPGAEAHRRRRCQVR